MTAPAPARTARPVGAPCWVDLSSADPERSAAFYGRLLGWTVTEPDEEHGGYRHLLLDDRPVAGLVASQPGHVDAWSVYLASEDAAATVRAAQAAGGKVVSDAVRVGDLGTMALVTDPAGDLVGVWEAGSFPGGLVGVVGAPGWFALHTARYDAAVAFLRDAFGWQTRVLSDRAGRYALHTTDGVQHAGVVDAAVLPDPVLGWSVSLAVADADAAAAEAEALGGVVLTPPHDTAYGRLAQLRDPLGAAFRLVAPTGW